MKYTALVVLILCSLTGLAQQKTIKITRKINTDQILIKKIDTSNYIGLSALDTLRNLKPGGGTPPPFYGNDAIQKLIEEVGEKYNNGFTPGQITEFLKVHITFRWPRQQG